MVSRTVSFGWNDVIYLTIDDFFILQFHRKKKFTDFHVAISKSTTVAKNLKKSPNNGQQTDGT